MKKLLGLFLSTLTVFSASALADSKIPNTKVSYKIQQDAITDENSSMIFIDEAKDSSGRTYMTFACTNSSVLLRLYSKSLLGDYSGEQIDFILRGDRGAPRTGTGRLREDRETGRLSVMEFTPGQGLDALRFFLAAQSNVVVRVNALTYTFPVKGLTQAYQRIQGCD